MLRETNHLKLLELNTEEKVKDLSVKCCFRNVTKMSFYHLRDIVKPFLSQADTEKLIHAFISSRLDYCIALLSGVSKKTHIIPILKLLHWLLVCHRIHFKILLLYIWI